jgi:tRNA G18 (ribose-2'-O)-methylase SpoU
VEALGMDAVMLTTCCSDPLYRSVVWVSVGKVFKIPWAYIGEDFPGFLKDYGFETAAAALRPEAISPDAAQLKSVKKLAVFFGSESTGLRQDTIDRCDHIVKIPMKRSVDSLNVAAASAVMFWELSKNRIEEGR